MVQLVRKDTFYIRGKLNEVMAQLKNISNSYTTVKEFLEAMTKPLE